MNKLYFAGLLSVLFCSSLFSQKSGVDTLTLDISGQALHLILEGDMSQTQPLSFPQLQAFRTQQGGDFINFGFAANAGMKYVINLSNGKDTLTFNQWDLPKVYVHVVSDSDTVDLYVNAFRNPELVFADAYKEAKRGKGTVEIPQAFELVNILLSLSTYGENEHLPFKTSAYADKVKAHFSPFKGHEAVKVINAWFEQQGGRDNENVLYYTIRMDGLSYQMTAEGRLEEKESHKYLGGKHGIGSILKEVEDFARVSSYQEFYVQTQSEREQMITQFNKAVDVDRIRNWLETNFEASHDHYWVALNPLSNGLHNTRNFNQDEFSEILMVITAPQGDNGDKPEWEYGASLERQLFTEVDHNYVNPLGIKNTSAVNAAMSNLGEWYDHKTHGGYNSALPVFLEYLTWGVFNCYARDVYPEDQFKVIRKNVTEFMINKRHFSEFEAFDSKLQELYASKGSEGNFEAITLAIIEWMKTR